MTLSFVFFLNLNCYDCSIQADDEPIQAVKRNDLQLIKNVNKIKNLL